MQDVTGHISQPKVATLKSVSQSFMIDSEQMQQCGMQVVDVHFVFHRLVTKFVCCTVRDAAFDATACQEK